MIDASTDEQDDMTCIYLNISGVSHRKYEIVDKDALYENIHENVPLTLNRVYVEGFSMKEYREKYSFEDDDIIEVKVDYIIDSLFYGKDHTAADFSYCKFFAMDMIAGIMIENNVFYYGDVDFSYSVIGDVDFSMKGCRFINSNLYFAYTVFGNKDIWFNKMKFSNEKCEIFFSGTDFGLSGEVSFNYTKGINGCVEFYECNFGEKALNFVYMDCPRGQFSFWEVETPLMPVDFVDSVVGMILMYKANINGLLDFGISKAEHIIIQESVIRDCVLLGNQGYRNDTCYCLKKSALLGRLRIQNRFSKRLFHKQLQYVYDPEQDEIVLCPTSSTDKASQLIIFSENYQSEGESDNADAAYTIRLLCASVAWIFEKLFLQIDNGDLAPIILSAYYPMVIEKIIGLSMFSIFVVSYTRKVIK